MPDEIERASDRLQIGRGEFRRVRSGRRQERLGVAAFKNDGEIAGIELAGGALGGRDIVGGVSITGTAAARFSASPILVPGLAAARIAWTARPWPSTA